MLLPLSNPLHVALYEPEIPPNTGHVARLCASTGTTLHLIGRPRFSFAHPRAGRAVLDHAACEDSRLHAAWNDFAVEVAGRRIWKLTAKADRTFWDADFAPGDALLFGSESRELPDDILDADPRRNLCIPMRDGACGLNLATTVGAVLYEALRRAAPKDLAERTREYEKAHCMERDM
jgi:tRNA (cytidine/uridine-2'-O-)-methyltransferase